MTARLGHNKKVYGFLTVSILKDFISDRVEQELPEEVALP